MKRVFRQIHKFVTLLQIEMNNIGPIKFHSFYLRIWIGKTVLIFDIKEGFKRIKKRRKEFKIIFGVIAIKYLLQPTV